jgi:lysozyme
MRIIIITSFIFLGLTSCPYKQQKVVKVLETSNLDAAYKNYGIDVSHYQGDINWNKVKTYKNKPIKFIYVKSTEGATWQDPKYQKNINGAKGTNIPVGCYHYFRTTSNPKSQFKNFMKTINKNDLSLVPMVDLEERKNWDKKTYHKNLKIFLKLIEDEFEKKPIIYTVNSFYNANLAGQYKDYKFFIGRYSKHEPNMKDKSKWYIWQFTEKGVVSGIPKKVDVDVLNSGQDIKDIMI